MEEKMEKTKKDKKGWIRLHRKLLENDIFKSKSPIGLKIWIAILLSASHQPYKIRRSDGDEVMLEPGDFCFGRTAWAKWLKIPPKTIFNWLSTFRSSSQIQDKLVDNLTPSILRVKNWKKYQGQDNLMNNPQGNPQDTNNNVLNKNELNKHANNKDSSNEKITPDPDFEKLALEEFNERTAKGWVANKNWALKTISEDFQKLYSNVKEYSQLKKISPIDGKDLQRLKILEREFDKLRPENQIRWEKLRKILK